MNDLIDAYERAIEELRASKKSGVDEIQSLSIQERVDRGYTIANADVEFEFYELGERPNQWCGSIDDDERYIKEAKIRVEENVSRFRAGTPVILQKGTIKFPMIVDDDKPFSFVLKPNEYDAGKCHICYNYNYSGWVIEQNDEDVTSKMLEKVAGQLMYDDEKAFFFEKFLKGQYSESLYTSQLNKHNALNDSQNAAVNRAYSCDWFHLIQGPPGTGKTTTIAYLVYELVKRNNDVLITGPTHTAINNCLDKISEKVQFNNVIKIGEKRQATEILANSKVIRHTRYPKNSAGNENGVVIGATAYATLTSRLQGWHFDYVIIDEASQMDIPLAIAAMLVGEKVIFVGDHKQLDPIIPEKSRNWLYKSSIFSLLANSYPDNITLLNVSYRLNQELLKIPANLFYNGRIKSGISQNKKQYVNFNCSKYYDGCDDVPQIINDESNEVLYVHYEYDSQGRSPFEAEITASIVKNLLRNGVELADIGIMSPYRAQVREVQTTLYNYHILNEYNFDDLFVDTVDRMQGQEKDYMIYTIANSNPESVERRLEFFFSPNRLNVALTRARVKNIVIANGSLYDKCIELLDEASTEKLESGLLAFKAFWDESTKINQYKDEGQFY